MALPSIFHHLKMTDTYFEKKEKKKRKFWPVLNFTYGIHICKTTNITGHGFFFFYSILNFLLFAFFLCLLSGHWKLFPVFDL